MAANKWMADLQKMDGVVKQRRNPHATVLRTPSPSVNFMFGGGWGLPQGYTALVSGPPKGGKTILKNIMVGQLHRDDPEAIAVNFDTEYRTEGQLTDDNAAIYGIEFDRYHEVESNSPGTIFDEIENPKGKIRKALEGGAPIKLIAIDSVTGVMGRKMGNADTVEQHLVGDMAQTLQDGLKRILPIQRKFRFGLLLISQARAEMDANKVKYEHRTWKPAVSWAVLHHCEYFIEIGPVNGKDGRTDLFGEELVDDSLRSMGKRGEQTGHRIRAVMTNSSMGPKGRVAEFTLDYHRGIINTHEEIAVLAVNRGIIRQSGAWCYFKEAKWNGVKAFAADLSNNPALQQEILAELKQRDSANAFEKAVELELPVGAGNEPESE